MRSSPLLANIYLHYCLDLWAERWRRQEARGVGAWRPGFARLFTAKMRLICRNISQITSTRPSSTSYPFMPISSGTLTKLKTRNQ
jgi:hypothetical protein